jgi:hypothetical protein
MDIIYNVVRIICSTFLGATAGAYVAFKLNAKTKSNEEENKRYTACLKAQFVFSQYYQTIYNIKAQFLDPCASSSHREVEIKHISFSDVFLKPDIETLSFILATKNPELLNSIMHTYKNCVAAIDSVKERNYEYTKLRDNKKLVGTPGAMVRVNVTETKFLKDYTDIMYRQTEKTLNILQTAQEELQNFIKNNFKGRHSLKFVDNRNEVGTNNGNIAD